MEFAFITKDYKGRTYGRLATPQNAVSATDQSIDALIYEL